MISAYENRSLAYPLAKVFLTQFGTVSGSTYRQAVYPPFMVELFVLEGFAFDARTLSSVRFHASPHENSPRRPTLNEAFEIFTRLAQAELCPEPRGGIWPRMASPASTAPAPRLSAKDLSRSPGFAAGQRKIMG